MTTLPFPKQDVERRPGDRPPLRKWAKPPSEAAYEALRSDHRLSPFDKLILSIVLDYCLAEGKCLCWPSTRELARRAGVDGVLDGGEKRVNRSLAKMERLGILERIGRYRMADWMDNVGGPRLNIASPRIAGDPPRFLLLWWKVPGLVEGMAVPICDVRTPGANVRVDKRSQDIGDPRDGAPMSAGDGAPMSALRTSSKSEPPKGTLTLTGSSPGEDKTPEPIPPSTPPVEAEAIEEPAAPVPLRSPDEILAELMSRRLSWRWPTLVAPLLWELEDQGADVPEVFRGKVPARPDPVALPIEGACPPRPQARPSSAPPTVATATTVDLISRLIKPDATDRDVATAARKLAEDFDDLLSLGCFRNVLARVHAKTLALKTVLTAYRAAKGRGVITPGKIFNDFLGRMEEKQEREERTRPGPRLKEPRPSLQS